MKEQVKKPNYFLRIITILFIIYMGLYIAISNGYYENMLREEVLITKDNIKEFESDIKSGKPIDLKDYQKTKSHDYGNIFNKSGRFLGEKFDYVVNDGISKFSGLLKELFTNEQNDNEAPEN